MCSISFPVNYVGYEVKDQLIDDEKMILTIYLQTKEDKLFSCYKCGAPLGSLRGTHPLKLKEMSVMGFKVFVHLFRRKGDCSRCKKARSESIEFLSNETPHATKSYSHWLGKLCEISTVIQASWFACVDKSTTWRADLERMERMLSHYHIPPSDALAVDEIYIGNVEECGKNRNDKFFTIITDLNTKRVLWVSRSRRKQALDDFFEKVGKKYCSQIKVVATDQHEDYMKSVKEHCKNAKHILDRFHVMKNFEEAINDCRKRLRKMLNIKNDSKLYEAISGKYRFIFLKRDSKRSKEEKNHMEKVFKENKLFMSLELVKERMLTFFDAHDVKQAENIFLDVRDMIDELGFPELKRWWNNLNKKWDSLKNYFTFRVTTALSEGINNVIKSLKRRSFGFRRLTYFALKIMQRCGFINSTYMLDNGELTFKAKKTLAYLAPNREIKCFQDLALN